MSKTQSKLGVTVSQLTPFAELHRSASLVVTDTETTIDFTTELSSILTASTVSNTITVPTAGYYEFTFSCTRVTGVANRGVELTIVKNGSAISGFELSKAANDYVGLNYNKVYLLAANDTMTVQISYNNGAGSGTDINIEGATLLLKKLT